MAVLAVLAAARLGPGEGGPVLAEGADVGGRADSPGRQLLREAYFWSRLVSMTAGRGWG